MKQKIVIIDNFLDTPLEYKNSNTPEPTQEISNKIAHTLQSNIKISSVQPHITKIKSLLIILVIILEFFTLTFQQNV